DDPGFRDAKGAGIVIVDDGLADMLFLPCLPLMPDLLVVVGGDILFHGDNRHAAEFLAARRGPNDPDDLAFGYAEHVDVVARFSLPLFLERLHDALVVSAGTNLVRAVRLDLVAVVGKVLQLAGEP